MTPDRLQKGLVIVLPGIEGRSKFNTEICRALAEGGVDWAIRLEDWTSPLGPLYNLRAEDRNRTAAEGIARRIELYHWDYPDRPVILLGQSGGAAIAAWTTESLHAGHYVDGVIMLAPSLSGRYMLDWALARSRRGIVSFHSSKDVMLGVGTTISGTMDGYHGSSAGRSGFAVPDDPERAKLYEGLLQVGWDEQMSRSGHTGGHLSSGAAGFVRHYVVPLIASDDWNRGLLDRIIGIEPADDQAATAPTTRQAGPSSQPRTMPSTQTSPAAPATLPVGPASGPRTSPATQPAPTGGE